MPKAVGVEPEDEDSMNGQGNPWQIDNTSSQDWLAQSVKQSVANWKQMLKQSKEAEIRMPDSKPIQKQPPSSDPYVEEFSSRKFGSGTLEFLQFE